MKLKEVEPNYKPQLNVDRFVYDKEGNQAIKNMSENLSKTDWHKIAKEIAGIYFLYKNELSGKIG